MSLESRLSAPARPRLFFLSGPTGSGKSTVLRHLLDEWDLPHLSAEEAGDDYEVVAERLYEVDSVRTRARKAFMLGAQIDPAMLVSSYIVGALHNDHDWARRERREYARAQTIVGFKKQFAALLPSVLLQTRMALEQTGQPQVLQGVQLLAGAHRFTDEDYLPLVHPPMVSIDSRQTFIDLLRETESADMSPPGSLADYVRMWRNCENHHLAELVGDSVVHVYLNPTEERLRKNLLLREETQPRVTELDINGYFSMLRSAIGQVREMQYERSQLHARAIENPASGNFEERFEFEQRYRDKAAQLAFSLSSKAKPAGWYRAFLPNIEQIHAWTLNQARAWQERYQDAPKGNLENLPRVEIVDVEDGMSIDDTVSAVQEALYR